MTNELKYVKESFNGFKEENRSAHKMLLEQVMKTNGTVRSHELTIATIQQKQKDHFFFHEKLNKLKINLEKMSRARMTLIITSVVAVFGLAIGILQIAAMIYISTS